MKKRGKMDWRRICVISVLLVIFVYSAVSLINYAVNSISTRRTNAELQAAFEAAEGISDPETPAPESAPTSTPEPQLLDSYQYIGNELLASAEEMLARNSDTVAWLYIPGVVDLPVVYRDNSYYLDHDFNGKKNKSGTLFLDELHPFAEDTQYMVIHGHNWYDGSMFGNLSHYRKKGYMEEHSAVYLYTLFRQEEYEVVGVLYVPADAGDEGYVPYTGMRKFQSLEQFYDFAELIRENALHWKDGAELLPGDAILALSTCYEDYRIVVVCRRINPQ